MSIEIPIIEDKLILSKKELIKIHLYIKMVEKGIDKEFSHREMDILAELYCFGGTQDKINLQEFFNHCFAHGFSKEGAAHSVRNALSKGRRFKIIKRKKANFWQIDKDYLPPLSSSFLAFKYFFTNYAENQ